jgi:hypothetical protein
MIRGGLGTPPSPALLPAGACADDVAALLAAVSFHVTRVIDDTDTQTIELLAPLRDYVDEGGLDTYDSVEPMAHVNRIMPLTIIATERSTSRRHDFVVAVGLQPAWCRTQLTLNDRVPLPRLAALEQRGPFRAGGVLVAPGVTLSNAPIDFGAQPITVEVTASAVAPATAWPFATLLGVSALRQNQLSRGLLDVRRAQKQLDGVSGGAQLCLRTKGLKELPLPPLALMRGGHRGTVFDEASGDGDEADVGIFALWRTDKDGTDDAVVRHSVAHTPHVVEIRSRGGGGGRGTNEDHSATEIATSDIIVDGIHVGIAYAPRDDGATLPSQEAEHDGAHDDMEAEDAIGDDAMADAAMRDEQVLLRLQLQRITAAQLGELLGCIVVGFGRLDAHHARAASAVATLRVRTRTSPSGHPVRMSLPIQIAAKPPALVATAHGAPWSASTAIAHPRMLVAPQQHRGYLATVVRVGPAGGKMYPFAKCAVGVSDRHVFPHGSVIWFGLEGAAPPQLSAVHAALDLIASAGANTAAAAAGSGAPPTHLRAPTGTVAHARSSSKGGAAPLSAAVALTSVSASPEAGLWDAMGLDFPIERNGYSMHVTSSDTSLGLHRILHFGARNTPIAEVLLTPQRVIIASSISAQLTGRHLKGILKHLFVRGPTVTPEELEQGEHQSSSGALENDATSLSKCPRRRRHRPQPRLLATPCPGAPSTPSRRFHHRPRSSTSHRVSRRSASSTGKGMGPCRGHCGTASS